MRDTKEINKYKSEFAKENYDRKQLYLAKGMNEIIKSAAEKAGISTNAWINKAIQEKIERDEKTDPVPADEKAPERQGSTDEE